MTTTTTSMFGSWMGTALSILPMGPDTAPVFFDPTPFTDLVDPNPPPPPLSKWAVKLAPLPPNETQHWYSDIQVRCA